MASLLYKRQCSNYDTQSDCYTSFWWTDTGLAIRYAIVALLFVVVALFLLGSYLHGQRRVKRGLPPLAYHRWMLARRQQPMYNPNAYYMGQSYGMPAHQPGPPAYNNWDAPPQYQPPAGGSKTMANQGSGRNDGPADGAGQPGQDEVQYPPPSHPPPQHLREA